MNLHRLIKQAEKFTQDNSPLILTTVGTVGVLTTAYLAGRAGFKAGQVVTTELYNRADALPWSDDARVQDLSLKETFNLTWKCYIPPAITGVVTVAAIISSNQIGTRRAAAMTSALAMSEKAFETYRNKVVEKLGEKKATGIRDEVNQDAIDANPPGRAEIHIAAGGDVICYETWTGRYFESDIETLKKAQNDLNYRINRDMYASLSDFYDLVGLGHTEHSDDIGWTDRKLLELEFVGHIDEKGKPVIGVIYQTEPLRDYWKFQG